MFQMLLVLALVAAVCAGVPSLLIAYANGKIALPRWLPGLLAFCCVLLAAMAWFPLSIDGAGAFVLYGFVGYCLRRAYTKTNVLPCMAFVLASSCVGLGAKWLICRLGVIREVPAFSPAEILAFLVLAQIAALWRFGSQRILRRRRKTHMRSRSGAAEFERPHRLKKCAAGFCLRRCLHLCGN